MNSNDKAAVRGTKSSSTGTRRIRMPYSKTLALILLVSSFWQMASSAPTPQQKDAAAGQRDGDDSVLGAESSMEAGKDYDDGTTELRYGGMWEREEPVEPPDIRNLNGPQSSPEIDPGLSSYQENAQHATSISTTTSTNTNPSPPSMNVAQRILKQEDQPDWVFNIVIQKEKALKSAFIAPDVNWLRDLVPKVVDVVDKPDTLIKETIFNAIDKQDVVKADHIEDSQIFINVVKSQVGSQAEVPEILARLRNLMQTGGPAVDSLFQRQNNGSEPSRNRAVVINVVIVNVLNVNILNVILPHSKAVIPDVGEKIETTDFVVEEDSYIVALKESQKNRNKVVASREVDSHHEKNLQDVPHSIAGTPAAQQPVNGRYLTEEHSYEPSSTARPLMAMEKDYMRSHDIQPTLQQLVDDKQPSKEQPPQIDPNASLEFVNLPSGPYFTDSVEKPLELEVLIVEKGNKSQTPGVKVPAVKIPGVKVAEVKVPSVKVPQVKVPAATSKPDNNPNKVQKVGMVSSMTNRATNVIRNQIRTIGFFGIPLLAGLAGTAHAWLPAMSALGRRRKKRSTLEYEEYDEWQPNRKVVKIDDRRRAIEDAQVLALLMGKRYMNVSKETLQDSIDNWKNRDQEANAAVPLHTTDANKLASTNKPLWFQFNRPGSAQTRETTSSTTTTAPSTIKRANYNEDDNYETNTNQYYSNTSPLFYSAAGATEDSMEHREIVDYDEAENAGPSTFPTGGNALTESGYYEVKDNKETQSEENTAPTYSESVTPHIHIIPSTSPSGYDFDIVANFVQAMMMNSNSKINENPVVDGPENREDVDGPEHREDVDGPEHREEIYLIKSPSIVNSSYPGGIRTPTTGTTVSLFAADPIMPNWGVKSENVTNSPVTYVSLKAPPKVITRPTKLPIKTTTSTQPSSSADYDDTDLIDGSDIPNIYDNVGAPLQFHEDETGITFFVTKEVPGKTTTPISSTSGLTEKHSTTNKPLPHWFSDPFEDGLFVGSSTASTFRPSVPPTSSVSTTISNTPLPTQSETRPTVPATRPSGTKPNFQSGNRPSSPLPNFQAVTQAVLQPSNSKPNFQNGNRPTAPFFNSQPNFQAGTRPPAPVTPPLQFNRPPKPISTPPKVQSSRPSSLLTMASFAAPNRLKPTVPPPVDVSSIGGSQNVKVTATNPPTLDLSTLAGDSSLVSATVDKHNALSSIIKGAASSTLPLNDPSTTGPSLVDSSSAINNAFGMYSSSAPASTNRPITTTTSAEEVLDSTVEDVVTQSEMNRTGYVSSTKRPVGGLHFINTSTDVVILSQFDVTPSSIFSTPEEESLEAEEDYSIEPNDAMVVDAAEGNQPDSVPAVSNLANLFIASSGSSDSGSSSSGSSSSGDSVSSGGVTTSTTAASFDPFAMFYTLGLASAGIFALTLPIWVPFVVAKKRRRTGSYGPTKIKGNKKKKYPAKKKKNHPSIKGTYGEPPPNHYKDLDEDLHYNDEDYYPAGPVNQHHQYQSTTIDDLYRGNSHDDYQDSDIENYSPLFRDLFSSNSNSDDVLSDPGPLSSEDIYGPSSPATYHYDDRKAARRRLSSSK